MGNLFQFGKTSGYQTNVVEQSSPPPPSLPPDVKVSALINAETASWNVNQIQTHFMPNDARLILSIPLSPRLPPDRLIWSLTPSGVFSARSAYHMLANNALVNNAGSSNPNPQKSFWRGLWQLRVPNKVKHFAWRACNDGLPTMVSLLPRHVVQSALCNNCHTQNEDPRHAVWGYPELECVWRDSATFNPTAFPPPADFTDLLARFLQVQVDDRAELFICIAWFLWNRRNAIRLGKPSHPLHLIGSLAG